MRINAVVATIAVFFGTQGLVAQSPAQPPATWPAAHAGGHALAYDSRRGMSMLYGDRGADATTLWGWDGSNWHAFNQPGPGLRRHIKLAYDSGRDRLVLYGGFDDSGRILNSDTWEWDGQSWTRVATDGPGPRASYALAYDVQRRRVILFGGLSSNGPVNDTWGWDGARWTKLADDGPSPRAEAGVVYDPRLQSILIAGGFTMNRTAAANGQPGWSGRVYVRDTWAWNGERWRQLAQEGGDARAYTSLALDPVSGDPLRIAGESDSAYNGDMSRFARNEWRAVSGAMVLPRHGGAAALDTKRQRIVLFGGSAGSAQRSSALADLWEWDGTRWQEIKPPSPAARAGAYMVYDAARRHTLLFGGWTHAGATKNVVYPDDLWSWDGRSWRRLEPPPNTPRPIGRDVPVLAYDEARQRVVMFGGRGDGTGQPSTWLTDVWEWDGTRWYRITNGGMPPILHPMASYDPVRRHVVVSGGAFLTETGGFARFSRTLWEWDGAHWTARDTLGPENYFPGAISTTRDGAIIILGGPPGVNRDSARVASRRRG